MSSFSPVIAGGSSVEPIDMTIGREADKRWQGYHDKQVKRRGGRQPETVNLPKDKNGKYMPIMGLGPKVEREKRQEYSTALQEHREDRIRKGKPQFSEAGSF
jgi:hypothetical protein